MTLIVSIEDQRELLGMQDVLDALEPMYRELADGTAVSRVRSDTICRAEDGVYGLKSMDGVVPSAGVGAVRINSDIVTWPLVNGHPRRVKVPAAPGGRWVGLILLFSISTGEPLGIVPDGFIQRMRVGGTSGLAVKSMARTDARILGVLGSGWQAGGQVLGACAVRDFSEVLVHSPNSENCRRFADEMATETGRRVRAVASPQEIMSSADVVLCATNSLQPVLHGASVRPGQFIGCIRPPELDLEAYRRADHVVIHDREWSPTHVVAGGPAVEALVVDNGWASVRDVVNWDQAPMLSQVIAGDVAGRSDDAEVTCFVNNIGTGAQFAAVGARLLQLAREKGAGHELPTEWFTQNVHP
jgi:alanine dehydrogenase